MKERRSVKGGMANTESGKFREAAQRLLVESSGVGGSNAGFTDIGPGLNQSKTTVLLL